MNYENNYANLESDNENLNPNPDLKNLLTLSKTEINNKGNSFNSNGKLKSIFH